MKKGDTVRLVQPVIEGTILETKYDNEAEGLSRLVEYTGADGEVHTRWFADTELQPVAQ